MKFQSPMQNSDLCIRLMKMKLKKDTNILSKHIYYTLYILYILRDFDRFT